MVEGTTPMPTWARRRLLGTASPCVLLTAASCSVLAATACQNEPTHNAMPAPLALLPAAASPAPLSVSKRIALADEDTACVIDSFEFRVVCGRREGEEVVKFGREGDGPGEFRGLSLVARVALGRVGVVDGRLKRLTTFNATGDRVSEVALPPMYFADGIRQATVFGSEVDLAAYSPGDSILTRIYSEVDINSGEVTWTRGDHERDRRHRVRRVGQGPASTGSRIRVLGMSQRVGLSRRQ